MIAPLPQSGATLSALGATLPQDTPAVAPLRRHSRLGDLGPRLGSAVVLIVLALGTLRIGGGVFVLFWLIAALAVGFEWQRLVGGEREFARLGLGAIALALAAFLASRHEPIAAVAILVGMSAALAIVAGPHRRGWAAAGLLYAGALVVGICTLRMSFPFGGRSVFFLFVVVWSTDIFAYFGGRLIGGPKFWPRLSPSKTWSGTLIGVFGGALLGMAFLAQAARLTGLQNPSPWLPLFTIGLVLAAVSQAGDIFESGVKRRFGVKDSSRLIPGHGGVMDRLDGFIAAVLCAAIIGGLRGFPFAAEGLFHWS